MTRRIKIKGGARSAPGGAEVVVDDEDWATANAYLWQLRERRGGLRIALAYVYKMGKRRELTLHSLLTGWERVIHVNGDGLDNRRENLRRADVSQLALATGAGQHRSTFSSSKYVGVTRVLRSPHSGVTHSDRWLARISVKGQQIHLGTFEDEEQAARAYDAAARRYRGPRARTNFPKD